jgi:hypothetical protein
MELERAKVRVAERERELSGSMPSSGSPPAASHPEEAAAVLESPPQAKDATRNDILDLLSRRMKKK